MEQNNNREELEHMSNNNWLENNYMAKTTLWLLKERKKLTWSRGLFRDRSGIPSQFPLIPQNVRATLNWHIIICSVGSCMGNIIDKSIPILIALIISLDPHLWQLCSGEWNKDDLDSGILVSLLYTFSFLHHFYLINGYVLICVLIPRTTMRWCSCGHDPMSWYAVIDSRQTVGLRVRDDD